MLMNKNTLVRNISKAYVIAKYLRELRLGIGLEAYLTSFIRKEHGTGQGFFGISNTGSYDCLKESLRGITDGLNLRFDSFKEIRYVSESCLDLRVRSKDIHRIEHTIELSSQYIQLENLFIIGDHNFTPNTLGEWFVENQIVCLIEQSEHTGKYTELCPFHKYSNRIFYMGDEISDYSHNDVRALNQIAFSDELSFIKEHDFSENIAECNKKLIKLRCKHRLPPLEVALSIANNEMALLDQHYIDKRNKAIIPSSRYYKPKNQYRWDNWLLTQ